MKRFLLLLNLLMVSTVTQAQSDFNTLKGYFTKPEIVLVASHRAVHNSLPENSIPAFLQAIAIGVDIIETDVKVSKDGIPFLLHDKTLNRTTNGKGDAEACTLAELKALFLKDPKGRITTERIPTLEELLVLAKRKIYIDLDLKTDQLDPVIAMIQKTDMSSQVFFFDDDTTVLAHVKRANSTHQLMPELIPKVRPKRYLPNSNPS